MRFSVRDAGFAMDVFDWLRKNKIKSGIIAIILFIAIPFGIDKLFNIPANFPFFSVQYKSSDILSFYGIVLGSATTILALIETIQHTEKLHTLDYDRKFTPLLDSNIYNHSDTSIVPYRVLYVNVRPVPYFDKISVSPSIDPRDLDDKFWGTQIDYLIQNISDTSAVDIIVYLNGQLLHGSFSLIAGSEASIGIYFFDERGHMIHEYPRHQSFHISITYTNGIRDKMLQQDEDISIKYIFMSLRKEPPFMPDYDTRIGLSAQSIIE